MSLYSQTNNQQLLWEMINKSAITNAVFPPANPQSHALKETWFRNVLTTFHQKNPNITTPEQLLQLNRNTLSFMMSELKGQTQTQVQTQSQTQMQQAQTQVQQMQQQSQMQALQLQQAQAQQYQDFSENIRGYSKPSEIGNAGDYNSNGNDRQNALIEQFSNYNGLNTRMEPKSSSYNNTYSDRQREYDSMLKGPVQMPVQFEQIEEKKIQNIAALTEQYRKLRDLEVPVPVAPPVTIVKSTTDDFLPAPPQIPQIPHQEPPIRFTIHDDLPSNYIEPQMHIIDDTNIRAKPTSDESRSIKWADEYIVSQLSEINKKLDKLFDILSNKMDNETNAETELYDMNYSLANQPNHSLEHSHLGHEHDMNEDIDRIRNVWQKEDSQIHFNESEAVQINDWAI